MTRGLSDLTWPRRTERLLLRPPQRADLPAVLAYRSDPEVARWLTAVATEEEEISGRFLVSGTALVVERDREVVGDVMLQVGDGWAQREVADRARRTQAELGWVVAPAHQGQGYAVEAVRELVTIAFALGVRRVEAGSFAENVVSRRVMEKVGLRQEGHFVRESLHRDGTWRDGVTYALLADEWDGSAGRRT
ncbi:GNAT family N-acetyltransferase [Ornithinimicrobium kibberense]|uniref:GNAT family N-acetyltransferase n=1 Tax=Ornithinimicrobium kibberense TaxID=282060 RepID=A0ABV5V2M7_9MICO|nr:GNAT family protein [Ornithinimicrobium kibberense]